MKKETVQKILGVVGVGLAFTAGIGGGFLLDNPNTITVTKIVEKPFEVIKEVPVPVEVIKVVEKEVIVTETVEKIVEVEDTEFLKQLCDREMYDDLIDCKNEVQAEDAAIVKAIKEIESNFGDELEDVGIVDDEDEVSIVRVYDNYEDITIITSDYDDEEYRFEIKVKIDDDEANVKKYVIFDVEVEDNEAKIRNVTEI